MQDIKDPDGKPVNANNQGPIAKAIELYNKMAARKGWTAPPPLAELTSINAYKQIILCNRRGEIAVYRLKEDGSVGFYYSCEGEGRKTAEELLYRFRPDDGT